eukprot:CAMPEP_0169193384 /NCGR_PEP_ID=MMETSP1016-20121227/6138_1 /TAXON_ID=342587 /ORGANISM="Karlodinium micrum, Strain CCMP2283" /LENGTH=62 /DNA_ID=CAMNT_0009269825 /DNA_START=391 /DNA_END=579 /DNA_ORIENTATION=-
MATRADTDSNDSTTSRRASKPGRLAGEHATSIRLTHCEIRAAMRSSAADASMEACRASSNNR